MTLSGAETAQKLNSELDPLPAEKRILFVARFAQENSLPIVFGTSFGAEDQLLTDYLAAEKVKLSFFTLDTGRLFPETYGLWKQTEERYAVKVQPYFPDSAEIEKFVSEHGINGFYDSVSNRKLCCGIRKVAPLGRALSGAGIWLTGLRREQDSDREDLKAAEYDERFNVIKVSPLIDLSTEDLWNKIQNRKVPYHPLHDKGFPSIGCAPCTRAIAPGEPLRAGRWWWESGLPKECGLHHHFNNTTGNPAEEK